MSSYKIPGDAGEITTEHAASSYNIPVYVLKGQVFGPGDRIPGDIDGPGELDWLDSPVAQHVLVAIRNAGLAGAYPQIVEAFLDGKPFISKQE